jgi:hypothetical protein
VGSLKTDQWPVVLVPVLLPEVSVLPVAEVPVPEPFELDVPLLVWPVELLPEVVSEVVPVLLPAAVPELLPLPHEDVPLVAPPPVALLPLADIGEVLSAALLVLPVFVELQAARPMAVSAPIIRA